MKLKTNWNLLCFLPLPPPPPLLFLAIQDGISLAHILLFLAAWAASAMNAAVLLWNHNKFWVQSVASTFHWLTLQPLYVWRNPAPHILNSYKWAALLGLCAVINKGNCCSTSSSLFAEQERQIEICDHCHIRVLPRPAWSRSRALTQMKSSRWFLDSENSIRQAGWHLSI